MFYFINLQQAKNMKKLLFFILVLISTNVYATPPNRTYSYTPNTVIDSNQNNANENALFAYLQAGVDTYAAGSITGAAVSGSASIPYISLSLSNSILGSDINTTTDISFRNLVLSGTFKLGSTNQGDIIYDNGTSFVRLTPGTSGKVLQTQGASANPQWTNSLASVSDYGTSASTSTARQGTAIKVAYGESITIGGSGSQAITNLPFTSSSSYSCTGMTSVNGGNSVIHMVSDSSSQMTIYNGDVSSRVFNWICIGI